MDNNERFGRLEEVLADVLIEMQGMNAKIEALQKGQQEIVGTFNRFAEAVLARMEEQTAKMDEQTAEMKGIRQDMKQLHDHEARLRKIEEVVFKKGA